MNNIKTKLFPPTFSLLLAACGAQAEATEGIPEVTSGPIPVIEILSGAAITCAMEDTTQSTVMGFDVIYKNMGTDAYMVGVMSAPEVGEIGSVGAVGEGRNGEGNWGIYPEFYDLPENTAIKLEIMVYAGADENAPLSSTSSLTYNCSTGETVSSTFNINNQ